MDVVYALNGITFVWNASKATANKHRHDDISFEQAAKHFLTRSLS